MGPERKQILVVDDDASVRQSLTKVVGSCGHAALEAADGRQALEMLREVFVNVVIADLKMPELGGFELLKAIKVVRPRTEVVLISAYGTVEKAVEALKEGACDFIVKPFRRATICAAIDRALRRQGEVAPFVCQEGESHTDLPNIVCQSPAMERVLDLVRRAAPTSASVLIEGETGTGKELIARAIHHLSPRRERPMIAMCCAAVPEALFEAELFGHEEGAFTGAIAQHRGKFELADGGTLFLDEVSQLSRAVQPKLLRVLQASEFERVGGADTLNVDVRVIAATNINLRTAIEAGQFREDLYYRLNVVKIHVPPLRERVEDIPLLVDHFIRLYSARDGKEVAGIDPDALNLLCTYVWPGSVRELENAIERAVVLARGEVLKTEDLSELPADETAFHPAVTIPIGTSIEEAEKTLIEETLRYAHGDKATAARLLGIARRTIYRKLHED